jgi:hypothetical protein
VSAVASSSSTQIPKPSSTQINETAIIIPSSAQSAKIRTHGQQDHRERGWHKMRNLLCVGGPLDGQTRAILEGKRFRAPIFHDVSDDDRFLSDERGAIATKTPPVADYQEQVWHTNDGDIAVWVPEGQSALQTFKRLLEHYFPLQRSS